MKWQSELINFLGTEEIQDGKISQAHQSGSVQHTDRNFGQSFKDFPAAVKVKNNTTHTHTTHTCIYIEIFVYATNICR